MTRQWCDKVKGEKLAELENQLNCEKESFFEKKLETLIWIKQEEIDCGVLPTITDSDIETARKQLEDWKALKSIKEQNH